MDKGEELTLGAEHGKAITTRKLSSRSFGLHGHSQFNATGSEWSRLCIGKFSLVIWGRIDRLLHLFMVLVSGKKQAKNLPQELFKRDNYPLSL